MGERQFGPYRLVRQIAVGGMAEIHLAKTKGIAGFEKYVALKMIHPNFAEDEAFIQMLVDEAKIAVQLSHGNIAQTFDLGRVGDTFYITMEYVDGADLYKILRRGSEQELDMPLDVAAFIAKEVASALDHAHRKRDHAGKQLGIVHRDVSPQNVLVSYSGEVKLVDFGIAKAASKVKQTAAGVIKGKYYYMSPEQAWGDQIDFRTDIFSLGIVLYEMITGQMLYLEEDLHKLLDMARRADIAPPSRLRRGVPAQLEKIVMHALEKNAGDRYQSASDFASDLERFLHAYAPVFTAAKVAGMIKQVLGDPQVVSSDADIASEIHDGPSATFTLDTKDLVLTGDELRDENSVIFKVSDLKQPGPRTPEPAKAPTPAPAPARVPIGAKLPAGAKSPGMMTRATAPTEPPPTGSGTGPRAPMAIPKITAPRKATPTQQPARKADEETRELAFTAPAIDDNSVLVPASAPAPQPPRPAPAPAPVTKPAAPLWSNEPDLDGGTEHTTISGPPTTGAFMVDSTEAVDATVVSDLPRHDTLDVRHDTEADAGDEDEDDREPDTEDGEPDDEGPTTQRDFTTDRPKTKGRRPHGPPPAALAANIQSPAVSAIHKPRPSKRTPQQGVPAQGNVLQQLVSQNASAPMPVPRAPAPQPPQPQMPPPPVQAPTPYATDASGMPLAPNPAAVVALPLPAPGYPPQQYQYPPQGYPPQGYPPQGYPPQGYPPQGYPPQGHPPQPQVSPGALYQFHPAPQPMTLTGQLRLFEVDEIPSQYRLDAARNRWVTTIAAAIVAISIAAGVTFLILRTTRDTAPSVGSIRVDSVPQKAEVYYDGQRLSDLTPMTISNIPVGTRHDIRVELARHKPYTETVDVPKAGGERVVSAALVPVTGKLRINSVPGGADIYINDQLRGRTPQVIEDVDMGSAKLLELKLKDYQPFVQQLEWPSNGEISIDAKLRP